MVENDSSEEKLDDNADVDHTSSNGSVEDDKTEQPAEAEGQTLESEQYLADLNLFMISSKEKSEDELKRIEGQL